MPVTGRKPNADGIKRHRVEPRHEWIEVVDVPFEDAPALTGRLTKATHDWWDAVSTMPHCILWDGAMWQVALDTARLHARWLREGKSSDGSLLTRREKILGLTLDARRDLRIRYVDVTAPAEEDAPTAIDDYRARLQS